ncbi:MAG TPA: response regulator [Rhodocyclaceae bacterium]|nr:response regulator [Rhodocyclaceae bacterium]
MRKILVVEDEPANMYLLKFMLSHAGFAVLEATTGEEGVELALRERPNLVLMDIQLPGIDGHEATKRIRASPIGKDIAIVALTSYAMCGDREKALAAGCTGYIEKPINPETFLQELQSYLEVPR